MGSAKDRYSIRFGDIENLYLSELSKNRHIVTKVFWLLLFLLMICSCLYIVVLLVSEYVQYASYNLIYTNLADYYTLPAITICNVNLLNATKLEAKVVGNDTLLDIYESLTAAFSDRTKSSTDSYGDLDDEEVYTKYAMNITQAIIAGQTTFAKSPATYSDFTSFDFTESGECMELNDYGNLVQKVNGPIGGLTMVLDAQTEHYLPSTENKGFIITLRMANETLLNKEFGFLVSPGFQYHINIQTQSVTRLTAPWGSCEDTFDLFANEGILTYKECFLNQILWMYMKLQDYGCGCFPWYFWQRYMVDASSSTSKYDEEVQARLVKYWSEELTEQYQIIFNDTCSYYAGIYSGDTLDKLTNIANKKDCDTSCRSNTECRYYMYSNATNDIQSSKDCYLYSDSAELETTDQNTTNLMRGDTQCSDLDVCSISAGATCENKIMDALMDETTPPDCYEPCTHETFSYDISSSLFPAPSYWDKYLSDQVPQYDLHDDATSNLVKLVFYTEQMTSTAVEQTPSYDIQNFIAEMGGVTDLFIGLSFFTVYQLIEWLVTRTVRKCIRTDSGNDVEDISMDAATVNDI